VFSGAQAKSTEKSVEGSSAPSVSPANPEVGAGPFATHSLSVQSATGKLHSPFPANSRELIFEWQLLFPSTRPLGIRWVADDVVGVEKDYVIANAKAEANKQAGRFSLSAPAAGFPPGKYHVEIWQRGSEIFREPFQISR